MDGRHHEGHVVWPLCLTFLLPRFLTAPLGDAESRASGARSRRHVIGRSWPRFAPAGLYRNDSAADLLGSDVAWHFREVPPLRNRLAVVHSGPCPRDRRPSR
jgi:hypothetical protein